MNSGLRPLSISGGMTVSVMAEAAICDEYVPILRDFITHRSNDVCLDVVLDSLSSQRAGEADETH